MGQIVIVTGGNREIVHYRNTLAGQSVPDMIIGVDAGAIWLLENGERIDLAVGDFDTIGEVGITALKKSKVKMIKAQPEKDATDTELAVTLAQEKNANRIVIYGGIGSRFDHSFANIHLLWKCQQNGIKCEVIDPWNRIFLIDQQDTITREYSYISLIPFTHVVRGVTLTGFKYPLTEATLEWGRSIGISNELVLEKGRIELSEGLLMVVMSNDK